MEDTLGERRSSAASSSNISLNPCFNGRYSRSMLLVICNKYLVYVLILVLMEDTLEVHIQLNIKQATVES